MKMHKNKRVKSLVLLLSVVLILAVTVGGTLAYLAVQTGPVTNKLAMSSVACTVNDDKSVTNDSTVQAYIRAAVVVNWVVDGGVHWQQPGFTVTNEDWIQVGDYYYYKTPVDPTEATGKLTVSVADPMPEGSTQYQLQILAEAIQVGGGAAAAVWGVDPATLS